MVDKLGYANVARIGKTLALEVTGIPLRLLQIR